jgi:hypothetical protein
MLLEGSNTEWATMVSEHIRVALHRGPLNRKLKFWTLSEALLLRPELTVSSKITYSILSGWYLVTEKLLFDIREHLVPSTLTVLQAYFLSLTSIFS